MNYTEEEVVRARREPLVEKLDEAFRTLRIVQGIPLEELENEELKEETQLAIQNIMIELDYLIDRLRHEDMEWDWKDRFVDQLEEREQTAESSSLEEEDYQESDKGIFDVGFGLSGVISGIWYFPNKLSALVTVLGLFLLIDGLMDMQRYVQNAGAEGDKGE